MEETHFLGDDDDSQSNRQTEPTPGPEQSDLYACHICLETASEPVVTLCGHLFCWPCIYRWLETAGGNACPVCKAGLSRDKMIPIYGRGDNKDPRETTPARPAGQRTEQTPHAPYHNGTGIQWQSFGPGMYGWHSHVTFGGTGFSFTPANYNSSPPTPSEERQMFARILCTCGLILLFSILMI